jgi:hypothetical protein
MCTSHQEFAANAEVFKKGMKGDVFYLIIEGTFEMRDIDGQSAPVTKVIQSERSQDNTCGYMYILIKVCSGLWLTTFFFFPVVSFCLLLVFKTTQHFRVLHRAQ